MLKETFNTRQNLDKIEGIVTAELRNAKTGKLEQKVTSTNFVAPPSIRYFQWQQRAYFKEVIYSLQNDRDNDSQPATMFDTIYLSTSTKDESDPDGEYHVPGQILGYATRTNYSGTSIYRGTANGTECEATNTYTKWRFDWPALAANGTIGSVGWMGSVANENWTTLGPTAGTMTELALYATTGSGSGGWRYITKAGPVIYAATSNTSLNNDALTTITLMNDTYATTGSFVVSGEFTHVRGLAWDHPNSRLWVIGRNNANYFIAAYNNSGTNVVPPIAIAAREYRTLAFDGTDLWTAVQSNTAGSTGSTTVTMYRIGITDGADVSNFTYNTTPASSPINASPARYDEQHAGLCWNAEREELWVRLITLGYNQYNNLYPRESRICAFDRSGNIVASPVHSNAWRPAFTGSRVNIGTSTPHLTLNDFDIIDNTTFLYIASSTVYHLTMDSLGSRSKLDTPITKNDTQTLTITYQINFPYHPDTY